MRTIEIVGENASFISSLQHLIPLLSTKHMP